MLTYLFIWFFETDLLCVNRPSCNSVLSKNNKKLVALVEDSEELTSSLQRRYLTVGLGPRDPFFVKWLEPPGMVSPHQGPKLTTYKVLLDVAGRIGRGSGEQDVDIAGSTSLTNMSPQTWTLSWSS